MRLVQARARLVGTWAAGAGTTGATWTTSPSSTTTLVFHDGQLFLFDQVGDFSRGVQNPNFRVHSPAWSRDERAFQGIGITAALEIGAISLREAGGVCGQDHDEDFAAGLVVSAVERQGMKKCQLGIGALPMDGLDKRNIEGHLFALKVCGRGQNVFRRALGVGRMKEWSNRGKEDQWETVQCFHNTDTKPQVWKSCKNIQPAVRSAEISAAASDDLKTDVPATRTFAPAATDNAAVAAVIPPSTSM